MDYDIEMEDSGAQYSNEAPQEVQPAEDILAIDVDDAQEPGEIDEASAKAAADAAAADDATTLIPTKVHIRGLDALNPDDIKAYVSEHYTGNGGVKGPFQRIEWIDDTSANLIFVSEEAAAAALAALSSVQIDDVTQLPIGELLPAKTYSAKPDDVSAGLSVRFAVASDKKESGAAQRSRFYLLHPEYDPEERRRNQQYDRRSRRDGGRSNRSYRSYRDERQDDRENDIRNNWFDVNLYDGDGPSRARRRSRSRSRSYDSRSRRRRSWSRSRSRDRDRSRNRRNQNRDKELFPVGGNARGKELFPEKLADSADEGRDRDYDRDRGRGRGRDRDRERGRLSGRSASPLRDDGGFYYDEGGDDDYDGRLADERAEAAAEAAARNRDKARAIKDRLSSAKDNGNGSSRDLFPSDSRGSAHMDRYDDTSALTSRLSATANGQSPSADAAIVSLFERPTNMCAPNVKQPTTAVSLTPSFSPTDRITRPSDGSTFNIRGLAGSNDQHGISIKGAASARELFPTKLSGSNGNGNGSGRGRNSGKEVFDNSLASRITRPRQRAEDLFH